LLESNYEAYDQDFRPALEKRTFPRIDPDFAVKITERLPQFSHKGIVLRAMGDKDFAHACRDLLNRKILNRDRERAVLAKQRRLVHCPQLAYRPMQTL
jgi:hypothetical protein